VKKKSFTASSNQNIMELLVAGFDDIKFNVEVALDEQHGALPLPFNGMDSKIDIL
jgi:hypothetical protein